jgi:phosphoglycolate phosphatase-like HAD superfamily hydrolase
MVGDYVFDLLAGRNAGTATVHLDVTGTFEWPEHTDFCVRELAELTTLLDNSRLAPVHNN